MRRWLVVDYGGVVSLPFDEAAYDELAARLGVGRDRLRAAYWQHRRAYDGGEAAAAYWSRVAGHPVADADLLNAIDVAGWSQVDRDVLALLEEHLAAGGRLALLSNAPLAQAAAFDTAPWAPMFDHLLASSRLGLTKPDPAIFARALDVLGAGPEEVTFVDDRAENVDAAATLGIRAIRYVGVEDLRRRLDRA